MRLLCLRARCAQMHIRASAQLVLSDAEERAVQIALAEESFIKISTGA